MKSLLKLALPTSAMYLGIMLMGFVDTMMLGRLGAAELGAGGVGNSIGSWIMVAGIGLLTGMEYPAASAVGAGRPRDAYRTFVQAHILAWVIGIPITVGLFLISFGVLHFGFDPQVAPLASQYIAITAFSMIPVFGFNVCRSYLQANHIAVPTALVLVVANLLNVVLNAALIWGKWGFPELGFAGSAYATLIVRYFMYFAAFGMVLYFDRKRAEPFAPTEPYRLDREVMRPIVRLGIPGTVQMALEVGVFALATALAARFSANELAAHQIVLTAASLTFMIPLGISSAAATLVGHALGARDYLLASKQGWRSFQLGWIFNFSTAILLILFADLMLPIFTTEPEVIQVSKSILIVAGLFQLFDGTQVIATGALRGAGDTRPAAVANFVGHWLIGFPISVWLGFYTSLRVLGLWIGLAAGLTAVALALLVVWRKKTRGFIGLRNV